MKRQTTTYSPLLAQWAIVRWLSPTQRSVVGQFRSRSDADSHLSVLRRLMPEAELQVVFDLDQD